jgi:WD40 repeat protein
MSGFGAALMTRQAGGNEPAPSTGNPVRQDARKNTKTQPPVVEKWRDRATLKELKARLGVAAFSPDSKTLATPSYGGSVLLWDMAKHEVRTALRTGHLGQGSVAFSPDSKTIASTGADGLVKLWDVETGKERSAWKLLEKEIQVRSGGGGGTGKPRITGGVAQLSYSPDGKLLAVAHRNIVKILDARTGKVQSTLEGHADTIRTVGFALGGKALVTGCADKTVKVWDVVSGKEHGSLQCSRDGHVAVSLDGKTLATMNSQDKTVTLYDVETRKQKLTWKDIDAGHLAFSRNGTLAIRTQMGEVKICDAIAGKELAVLQNGGARLLWTSLTFSPDGNILASSGNEFEGNSVAGVLHLWQMRKD